MRRVIALSLMCLIGCGTKPGQRLLGKWKSDKEATLQIVDRFRDNSHIAPEKRSAAADLFGKLVVEYTSSTITTEYEGNVAVMDYEVVARDEHSVVLSAYSDITGKDELSLIRFDGPDRYRLYARGLNFPEVFRRIDDSAGHPSDGSRRGDAE